MNYRNIFLYITGTVVIVLFVLHTIYTNKMSVTQEMQLMYQQNDRPQIETGIRGMVSRDTVVQQIRNATAIERATHSKEKCHRRFNCTNGENPPFEPTSKTVSFTDLKLLYPEVKLGGSWSPEDCDLGQRVAIIIPYRDREEHLKTFLANIIPFLKMQRKAFTIFVVEQAGDVLFNRASLLNIGFVEALKLGNYSCFIFHDVDMVPIRLCNLYECYASEAMHLGVSRNKDPPRIVYRDFLGGVLSLHKNHMVQINGFSNIMFGWGGEDDEIFMRLKKEKIKISHRLPVVGNYVMPAHKRDTSNPSSSRSFKQVYDNANYRKVDGLSSLNYTLKELVLEPLYTKIVVGIAGPTHKQDLKAFFAKEVQKLKQKLAAG